MPSQSAARWVFENERRKLIDDGVVVVDSFRKTNGKQSEIFGVEVYELEYAAVIRWPRGLNPQCVDTATFSFSCYSASLTDQIRKAGQIDTLTGSITFERTERGWKGEDGNVY